MIVLRPKILKFRLEGSDVACLSLPERSLRVTVLSFSLLAKPLSVKDPDFETEKMYQDTFSSCPGNDPFLRRLEAIVPSLDDVGLSEFTLRKSRPWEGGDVKD